MLPAKVTREGGTVLCSGRRDWHQSSGGKKLHCASLAFPLLLLLLFTIMTVFWFILSHETVLISTQKFYFDSSPYATRVGVGWQGGAYKGGISEWLHGISCPVGIKTMTICHQGKFVVQGDVLGRYSSIWKLPSLLWIKCQQRKMQDSRYRQELTWAARVTTFLLYCCYVI